MSGTSLDGVDAAFIETDGEKIFRFGPNICVNFSQAERAVLKDATQAALKWKFKGSHPDFKTAETVLHDVHIEAYRRLRDEHPDWVDALDIVGFHGQTLIHQPPQNQIIGRTLQIGDGLRLARALGVPVYYDFRTADVTAGGQGAPLAPIYHKALADFTALPLPVSVLNIGGVGNVTCITQKGVITASDTGPGNGPLDLWIESKGLGSFDQGGQHAMAGTPDFNRIYKWLGGEFFQKAVPKSADRYDFDVLDDVQGMSAENGASTLAAFTCLAVSHTLSKLKEEPQSLIICGGGRHNMAMRLMLRETLKCDVLTAEDVGWSSDALEAQAFAYLAVRSKRDLPLSFPRTTGVKTPQRGGVLAHP